MISARSDNPRWQLRPAKVTDAAAISALLHESVPHYIVSDNEPMAEWLIESISDIAITERLNDPRFWYYVAHSSTTLVGMIAIRDYKQIYHLFVAESHHRQGIARALWEIAKKTVISSGNQQGIMVRSSLYAVPVYQRFGFKPTSPPQEKDGIVYVPMQCDFAS